MQNETAPRQDAVHDPLHSANAFHLIERAQQQLMRKEPVDIHALLPAYQTLRPVSHSNFTASLSLAFFAGVMSLGGPALSENAHILLSAGSPRSFPIAHQLKGCVLLEAPPSSDRLFDALALVLGIAHEAQKAQRALGTKPFSSLSTPAALLGYSTQDFENVFDDEKTALRMLNGLLQHGANRTLHALYFAESELPFLDDNASQAQSYPVLQHDGPLFVVAGMTERIHDLLSPYVRRLRSELTKAAATPAEDHLYETLPFLFSDEKEAFSERIQTEASKGFAPIPGGFLVQFEKLSPTEVDRRAHGFVSTLKQKKTTLVVIERHPKMLHSALKIYGDKTRALLLLTEGFTSQNAPQFPESVLDVKSGIRIEFRNAFLKEEDRKLQGFSELSSHPSIGFATSVATKTRCIDSLTSPLLQAAFQSRAEGALEPSARIGLGVTSLFKPALQSDLALQVLARMAKAPTLAARHASEHRATTQRSAGLKI